MLFPIHPHEIKVWCKQIHIKINKQEWPTKALQVFKDKDMTVDISITPVCFIKPNQRKKISLCLCISDRKKTCPSQSPSSEGNNIFKCRAIKQRKVIKRAHRHSVSPDGAANGHMSRTGCEKHWGGGRGFVFCVKSPATPPQLEGNKNKKRLTCFMCRPATIHHLLKHVSSPSHISLSPTRADATTPRWVSLSPAGLDPLLTSQPRRRRGRGGGRRHRREE